MYYRYYNRKWMTIIDILIGSLISILLFYNSIQVVHFIHKSYYFLTDVIFKSQISWLMVNYITFL